MVELPGEVHAARPARRENSPISNIITRERWIHLLERIKVAVSACTPAAAAVAVRYICACPLSSQLTGSGQPMHSASVFRGFSFCDSCFCRETIANTFCFYDS